VVGGYEWCASIDLEGFFDEIPHNLIFKLIRRKSERAANRVMEGIGGNLEGELKLPVNQEKSQVALVKDVAFLEFSILRRKTRVRDKARIKFKDKVRELTRHNNPLSMYQIYQELNEYLRGRVAYFRIREFQKLFFGIRRLNREPTKIHAA